MTLLIYLQERKKTQKLMEIVNFEEENLHIFRTNWGISMKCLGNFPGLYCLHRKKVLGKPQGGSNLTPRFLKVN